jgi:hypothetical protein
LGLALGKLCSDGVAGPQQFINVPIFNRAVRKSNAPFTSGYGAIDGIQITAGKAHTLSP